MIPTRDDIIDVVRAYAVTYLARIEPRRYVMSASREYRPGGFGLDPSLCSLITGRMLGLPHVFTWPSSSYVSWAWRRITEPTFPAARSTIRVLSTTGAFAVPLEQMVLVRFYQSDCPWLVDLPISPFRQTNLEIRALRAEDWGREVIVEFPGYVIQARADPGPILKFRRIA